MRLIAVILLAAVPIADGYPVELTEAQRYYDLGVSYIKSDLYEKGLETLNQVAFLYPDSDVADDALYQLALIRERVGNGEVNIAREESLEAQEEVLKGLTGRLVPDIIIGITAQIKGEAVFDVEKEEAIAQYLLALDYLNTLFQRYPGSDKLGESNIAFERIAAKIDQLMAKPIWPPPKRPVNTKERLVKFALVGAILVGSIVLLTMLSSLE